MTAQAAIVTLLIGTACAIQPRIVQDTPQDTPPVALTSLGNIVGARTTSAQQFLGVPYARPPVGNLRFRPAKPATPYLNGRLHATSYGAACVQPSAWWIPFPSNATREDCLTINIWAPLWATRFSRLPVLMYIHGGGNIQGSGSLPQYNGSHFAEDGIILATINYRLGAFGQLALEEIEEEDPSYPSTGGMNYLTDQQQALHWLHEHIGAFGGDSRKISIFGESAGSISVCSLVASPRSKGLFRAAAMQSGACNGPWGPADSAAGKANGLSFMKSLNATSLAGLRGLSAQQLLNSSAYYGLYPSVDGVLLPDAPKKIYERGGLALDPGRSILLGSNTLDGVMEAPWRANNKYLPNTTEGYQQALELYFGEVLVTSDSLAALNLPGNWSAWPKVVEALYPAQPNASRAYLQINSDVCVVCPTRSLAAMLHHSRHRPYLYRFGWNPRYDGFASHASEVGLVFGYAEHTCLEPEDCPATIYAFNATLSKEMRRHWVALAEGRAAGFPEYLPGAAGVEGQYLAVTQDAQLQVKRGYEDGKCLMWAVMGLTPGGEEAKAAFCTTAKAPGAKNSVLF